MMKKLSFLFLSLVALGAVIVSCSKEDPTPTIEGKWTYDTYTYTNADGTTDAPQLTYDGTWKLENNKISTTLSGDTQVSSVILVSVSAKELVFKYPQPNDEYYLYTLKKS